MGILDIVFVVLILAIAQKTITFFSRGEGPKCRKDLQSLWWYHLAFGIAYMLYVTNFGGDALGYWRNDNVPLLKYLEGGAGTAFVHVLNYPFVYIIGLSFFAGSVLYCFIGFLGILFFYLTYVRLVSHNTKVKGYYLFPLVLFLPNLHFWASGVGKDTLSFFSIGLFVFSTLDIKRRFFWGGVSLFLLYYVRPHMAFILLTAFGVGAFFDPKLKVGYKLALTACFAMAVVLLVDDVLEYVKMDELSTESFDQFSNNKVEVLMQGNVGSSVDVTSYPLSLKIFTFLYRPLFFDVHNITSLLASLENVFLLLLTIMLFKARPVAAFKQAPYQVKALVIFVLLGAIGFSSSMGNLGIMVRMKNMFTPALLIFILYALSARKEYYLKRKMLKLKSLTMEQDLQNG